MSVPFKVETAHIRQLDVRRDLPEVADLIELAFANHMDADGRDYIRYIRRVASNKTLIRWIPGAAERVSMPLHGYVWVEDGKIAGNLTLIPFFFQGRWIYLIANVAVHPDFRRMGIGRMLTQRALEHIREHQVSEAWLQVRDDNPVAHHLYQQLGFLEMVRRSTWQNSPTFSQTETIPPPEVRITRRQSQDWEQQARWLQEIYPPEVSWNLSFDWHRLRPGFLRSLGAWVNGESFLHWTARLEDRMIGGATWEPGRSMTDMVWLGIDPQWEDLAVHALLTHIRCNHSSPNYLLVNYPAGQADDAFVRAGFNRINTLIWMSIKYNDGGRNENNHFLV